VPCKQRVIRGRGCHARDGGFGFAIQGSAVRAKRFTADSLSAGQGKTRYTSADPGYGRLCVLTDQPPDLLKHGCQLTLERGNLSAGPNDLRFQLDQACSILRCTSAGLT
jgi:hypothetical protein